MMKNFPWYPQALALSAAVGMVLYGGTTVRAATFDATIGSTAVTIVETDSFKEGDTPGNTVRADGSGTFWASTDTSNTDGLWRDRAYGAFNTGYNLLPGATDQTFEIGAADEDNAPALRTTVGGLDAALYEVFELYTTREDGNSDDGGIRAVLNDDVVANGIEYRWEQASDTLPNVEGVWTTSIVSLGLTAGDATGFFVEAMGKSGSGRSHHVGVAYRAIAQLTLEVNTATGQIALKNNSGTAIDTDAYEITSSDGSLSTSWNSLEQQDYEGSGAPGDGEGWEEMGVPSSDFLSEAILTTSYSFADGESASLGSAFNTSGGTETLDFRFRLPDGAFFPGIIEYVDDPGTTLFGDFNNNGQVEQGDLDLVLLNWGEDTTTPPGWENDPPTLPVGQDDLDRVRQNWGNVSVPAADAVPEPSTLALLSIIYGTLVFVIRKRR